MQQKLVPDPFLILVNNPKQSFHLRNYFKNKIFWKRIIKKPEKVNFIFSFEPSPSTQQLPGTSDQSLFMLQNKFRKIPLLVIYYLTKFDDII